MMNNSMIKIAKRQKTKKTIKVKTLRLFKEIAKILSPPPKLTVSEWADQHRKLSPESSAEPGQWRTDRAPYQKEIMDAVSDPEVEKIVVMCSSQIGKTEIQLNIIGYHIDYDPAPIMVVMPTESLAKGFSKKRLATMIRDTPNIKEKVTESKSRDSDNTILEKGFPGGYVVMVGANSPTNLSSRPIRILLADEVDRFPFSAGNEGDPLSLAEKRTTTFHNRKKIFVSTPTEKETSRIEAEFETSSKEEWQLACPMCGRYQPLAWAQIRFEDTTMECRYCKERFTEFEWKEQPGKWVAEKPEITNVRGFHLNALASPWERWSTIIDNFRDAKAKGKDVLKTWVNTTLGESWEDQEGEMADEEVLLKRRERYGCELPEKVLYLTAGVDVQDDRLEIEVVGWSHNFESWGIEYRQFMGDPTNDLVWNDLDQFLLKEFSFEDGNKLMIACCCIDSGYNATDVYKFCKKREHRRIFAVKGKGGYGIPFISKPSRTNSYKCALFTLGVDEGKSKLISRLRVQFEEEPGYCHFPIESGRGYDQYYFKAITSERRVVKWSKGRRQFEWIKKKSGARNEALDLRNYATAAVEIMNPPFEVLEKTIKNRGNSPTVGRDTKNTRRGVVNKGIQI